MSAFAHVGRVTRGPILPDGTCYRPSRSVALASFIASRRRWLGSGNCLQFDAPFQSVDICCLWRHYPETIRSSLLTFAQLESFEIRNATGVVDQELLRQLSKLGVLKVHSDQDPSKDAPPTAKKYLSPGDLASIAKASPWVRELKIDVPSDEATVGSRLQTLMSL
jgi:hypothetical protein